MNARDIVMIWEKLSNFDLQKLIGDSLLTEIQQVLPAWSEYQNVDIYQKKILSKIATAFIPPSFFKNQHCVSETLNCLSREQIDACIQQIKPDYLGMGFQEKINFIARRWNDPRYNRTIITWAGLSDEFLLQTHQRTNPIESFNPVPSPYKTLKDYQISVFLNAQQALQIQYARFILQMPTGSGKTRTAMEVITDFFNSQKDDTIVCWLAHSEELCEQAFECFREVWQHVARKPLQAHRCWGNHPLPGQIAGNAFLVAGFSKMYAALRENSNAFSGFVNNTKLIIVDEAHKVLAPTYQQVTRALQSSQQGTRIMGLTATPGRHMDNEEGNRALAEFFFNKFFTISNIPDGGNAISYLRNKKVLSKLDIDTVISTSEINLTANEKQYLERNFDFSPGFLERLGKNQIRNIEILKKLEKYVRNGHQILFFGCSVEHSKFICSFLVCLGYKAAHVDGATDKKTRQELLRRFKKREIQIMCNFGVLSTGFDAPNTDVVCIARPTRSIVLYSQMIGRGLRGPAIGGTESCTLISVKDNIANLPDYQQIFDYFDDYWAE